MNQEKTTPLEKLNAWQDAVRTDRDGSPSADEELPLRSELFSAAQMAAQLVARGQVLAMSRHLGGTEQFRAQR